jgi:hypothetical protein
MRERLKELSGRIIADPVARRCEVFESILEVLQSPGLARLPERPLFEVLKLVMAGIIGWVVTRVRKHQHGRPMPLPVEHAMMLLALTGAMMMIIIGDSLPRALGIAGAASIVRFRTPVDDPRDTTLFLILLGLGMTCGIGAFAMAGMAAIFVCAFLLVLDYLARRSPRHLELEVVAEHGDLPTAHIEKVLLSKGVNFELHEMSLNKHSSAKYVVNVPANIGLTGLSREMVLESDPEGLSITWNEKKWMRQ